MIGALYAVAVAALVAAFAGMIAHVDRQHDRSIASIERGQSGRSAAMGAAPQSRSATGRTTRPKPRSARPGPIAARPARPAMSDRERRLREECRERFLREVERGGRVLDRMPARCRKLRR